MNIAKPLTERMRADGRPVSLQEYEASGGYEAVRKTVGKIDPKDLQQTVIDSNLRGRGGAGFPTGKKWGFVPMGDDAPVRSTSSAMPTRWSPGRSRTGCSWRGTPTCWWRH